MATRKASAQRTNTVAIGPEAFAVAQKEYSSAMEQYLVKRQPEKAIPLFKAFLERYGDDRDLSDMADRARVHLSACEASLAPPPPPPASADEWLIEAIGHLNRGGIEEALSALERAASGGAPAGRLHYVRAAALARSDRLEEALEELRTAIDADPENRAHSIGDPDFERLRETAGYIALVEPPADNEEPFFDVNRGGEEFENGPPFAREDFPKGPAIY